ncbi:MAG TPA: MaoC/PaaZ C-terminal domain-containing protein [Spirochaetota bacterium]|mgnify:CR=1 FL=1|nr:MaoC/PaaZ C-terminal domain-containing protein [Spirochaetota bacterium]
MINLKYEDINEGQELTSITKEPITQVQLIKYAGASGDFNQIHTVPEYAKEAGLSGTITHGMLIAGILGQMISNNFGVKQVKNFSVNFKAISKPGDILSAKGIVKKKYENENGRLIDCKVFVEDQNQEVKLEGKVTIKF